jgi:hypothetical protein
MPAVVFWHAAEHLGMAAALLIRCQEGALQVWLEEMCHILNREVGGAGRVIRELQSKARVRPWAKESQEAGDAVKCLKNQHGLDRGG